MNKKRLLKMADFVETIPRRKFDMSIIWSECGSVGCAIGHAANAKLFRDLRWNGGLLYRAGEVDRFSVAASHLFGIEAFEARGLFMPDGHNHTPKRVSRNIRRFVETGKLP